MGLATVALQALFTGLSGALMPGPLLTLVIARSSSRGIAAAALLTAGHAGLELLIVVLFTRGLRAFFELDSVGGVIGLVGGAVLVLMGADMVRSARRSAIRVELSPKGEEDGADRWWVWRLLGLGALVSASNPYFIGWWATVGAKLAGEALEAGRGGSAAFYLGHIASDFSWFVLVGFLVARGARRLDPIWYTRVIGVCGLGLVALGLWFITSGWALLTEKEQSPDTREGSRITVSEQRTLRIGLPKGSLQEATFTMFRKAGFNISVGPRAYYPDIDDPELEGVLLRAQEIAGYVQDGVLDLGLTGLDWITEQEADVHEVEDLIYAKQGLRPYRWVLAVPEGSPIQAVQDLQGKRIATELVNASRKWLAEQGVEADVEYSWGATEAKCPDLVDAIIEGTETGSTLRAHNLRVVAELFESTTRLIANKRSWEDPWKRAKTESIALLLRGALAAEEMVGLKMNVLRENLDCLIEGLPALKNPTISSLSDESWVAVETIISQHQVRELIPELKRRGAQGIIEYPLNKVIP